MGHFLRNNDSGKVQRRSQYFVVSFEICVVILFPKYVHFDKAYLQQNKKIFDNVVWLPTMIFEDLNFSVILLFSIDNTLCEMDILQIIKKKLVGIK